MPSKHFCRCGCTARALLVWEMMSICSRGSVSSGATFVVAQAQAAADTIFDVGVMHDPLCEVHSGVRQAVQRSSNGAPAGGSSSACKLASGASQAAVGRHLPRARYAA